MRLSCSVALGMGRPDNLGPSFKRCSYRRIPLHHRLRRGGHGAVEPQPSQGERVSQDAKIGAKIAKEKLARNQDSTRLLCSAMRNESSFASLRVLSGSFRAFRSLTRELLVRMCDRIMKGVKAGAWFAGILARECATADKFPEEPLRSFDG